MLAARASLICTQILSEAEICIILVIKAKDSCSSGTARASLESIVSWGQISVAFCSEGCEDMHEGQISDSLSALRCMT